MMVSNDMFDRRIISRQNMRGEVNKYMTVVMQEDPLDASLIEYDDTMPAGEKNTGKLISAARIRIAPPGFRGASDRAGSNA